MTISKRKNRRNLQRSKKGGVLTFTQKPRNIQALNFFRARNAAPNLGKSRIDSNSISDAAPNLDKSQIDSKPIPVKVEEGITDIVVILSKLAGDVPAKADQLSEANGNAPIYFGWCPFNVRDVKPYDLIKQSENITHLKAWKNVDHTNFEHSKILERWSGVSTDAINSSSCINFLHTLQYNTWPTLLLPPRKIMDIEDKNFISKNNKIISEFYMKRIAYVLNYDKTQQADYFTTFLKRFVCRIDQGQPLIALFLELYSEMASYNENNDLAEQAIQDALDKNPDHDKEAAKADKVKRDEKAVYDKKAILDKWAKANGKVFHINFDGLDARAMKTEVFNLLANINNINPLPAYTEKIQSQDIYPSYADVYDLLPITEMYNTVKAESFRFDNFFKHWIDEIPEEPPLVTTDGCVAMAVVAIDILKLVPTNSETQLQYMLEMATFTKCGLREWSSNKLQPLLEIQAKKIQSPKCVHVIVDLESDDLFALRIFANFYSRVVVYITSNSASDNTLFDLAKAYLETDMPEHVTIDSDPVVCHTISPNTDAIIGHYEILYEPTNTAMGNIIRHFKPNSRVFQSIEKPSLVAAPAPIKWHKQKIKVEPIEVTQMVNDRLRDESDAVAGLTQEKLTGERETAATAAATRADRVAAARAALAAAKAAAARAAAAEAEAIVRGARAERAEDKTGSEMARVMARLARNAWDDAWKKQEEARDKLRAEGEPYDADENFGGSKRKKSKKSRRSRSRSRRSRRSRTSRTSRSIRSRSRRSKISKEN
jgi:hypothetical protein